MSIYAFLYVGEKHCVILKFEVELCAELNS
jgi:hypothetical protein